MAVRLLARHLISMPHLFACAVCTPAQLQAQIKVLRSALESGTSGGNGSGPLPGDVASATADADNAAHEAAAAKERLALVARQLLAVVRTTSLKPGGGASIAKLLKVVVDNVVSGDGAGVTLKELSVRCLLGAAAAACTCSQGLALDATWCGEQAHVSGGKQLQDSLANLVAMGVLDMASEGASVVRFAT